MSYPDRGNGKSYNPRGIPAYREREAAANRNEKIRMEQEASRAPKPIQQPMAPLPLKGQPMQRNMMQPDTRGASVPQGMMSGGQMNTLGSGFRQGGGSVQSPQDALAQNNPMYQGGAQGQQNPMMAQQQDESMKLMQAQEKRIAELEAMVARLHANYSSGGGHMTSPVNQGQQQGGGSRFPYDPNGGGGMPRFRRKGKEKRGPSVNGGYYNPAKAKRAKSEGRAMDRMTPSSKPREG